MKSTEILLIFEILIDSGYTFIPDSSGLLVDNLGYIPRNQTALEGILDESSKSDARVRTNPVFIIRIIFHNFDLLHNQWGSPAFDLC